MANLSNINNKLIVTDGGNLLVNKTAANNAAVGVQLMSTGDVNGTVSGDTVARFNRLGTDGEIIRFQHDTSTDGAINSLSGRIAIGSGTIGVFFDSIRDVVTPHNMTTNAYSTNISLGRNLIRFKDLYLSGIANIAGKITAPILSIQNQINTASSNLEINYANGDGTTTNFKDFYVRDGKNAVILNIQGSSKNSTFSGTVETTTLRTDVVNNKANSANIIYRSGTDTLVGGGGLTAKVYIQDGGNVGIGVTDPLVKLQVYGNPMPATGDPASVEDMFTLYRNGSPSVWSGGATLALGRYSTGNGSAPKSRLDFKLKNAAGSNTALPETTVMTMQSNGLVGIGTTSPIGNFNINGGTGDVQANDVIQTFNKTTSTGNVTAAKIKLDHYNTNYSDLQFLVKTTASSAESDAYYTNALTILGRNANVGIGTNNPGKKLEVAGSYKLGTNAWIQYDAAYPYTISMLNGAGIGNLILNAGYLSSGYESKIELQGGNTAGAASITFTTASSQALVIKNGGDLTVSGSIIDANGVRTYRNGGSMNNGVAYTFDITVPNDSGSGTIHHVDAMMTHYDTGYGCLLNCYAYTRGTAVSTQTNLVNQTSTAGGGWFVTKPNSTTLRITKTAGTYVGTGYFQIVVITKST